MIKYKLHIDKSFATYKACNTYVKTLDVMIRLKKIKNITHFGYMYPLENYPNAKWEIYSLEYTK